MVHIAWVCDEWFILCKVTGRSISASIVCASVVGLRRGPIEVKRLGVVRPLAGQKNFELSQLIGEILIVSFQEVEETFYK